MRLRLSILSVFLGLYCITPVFAQDLPKVTSDAQHNTAYEKGIGLISAHLKTSEHEPKVTEKDRSEIAEGINYLQSAIDYNPQNWGAMFFKGKAYQALGNHLEAVNSFKDAYQIRPNNPDVAREYVLSCIEVGDGHQAIIVSRKALKSAPSDVGLQSNIALAYLISNQNQEALQAIDTALKTAPDDKIALAVRKLVTDVMRGKRPQPKSGADF